MKPQFFAGNRRRLLQSLQPHSLVVLTAFMAAQRDVDNPHAFQQESNFWYLCGVNDPDWLVILDTDTGDEWLVAPHLNRFQQTFLGGITPAEAARTSGITTVLEQPAGKELLAKLLTKKKQVYTLLQHSQRVYGFQPNGAQRRLQRQLRGVTLADVRLPLGKLRAIKQPDEIAAIQEAVDITVDGIAAVYKELKSYKTENQIDAKLYYEFRKRGAIHGFDPIVASGKKTCIMHSAPANDPLRGWLLLDVGARVPNYSADITRTIPLGTPTDRELQVYHAVQRMHDMFESVVKPGGLVKDILKDAYTFVGEEMVKLGILKKVKLTHDGVFKFMPHGITHGLGIDTHDPLGRPEIFAENMVLTNEVGVYIPNEGIGIRIENDMVITKTGVRNMGARLPIGLPALAKMVQ